MSTIKLVKANIGKCCNKIESPMRTLKVKKWYSCKI